MDGHVGAGPLLVRQQVQAEMRIAEVRGAGGETGRGEAEAVLAGGDAEERAGDSGGGIHRDDVARMREGGAKVGPTEGPQVRAGREVAVLSHQGRAVIGLIGQHHPAA